MKNIIIGTAGHIDHGKTALVKALTGTDADRLPEEKARGLTIDIGFAFFDINDKVRINFVDVPGHERFVKNMLAGATGFDAALLIIAADDGIMPQTREHLEILELLDITHLIVVITKCDLVDDEWLEMVKGETEKLINKTKFKKSGMLAVSSINGNGIDKLKEALLDLALKLKEKNRRSIFRLPVDRTFTIEGFGCVVTGSVVGGKIGINDEVEILPAKTIARVRGIEINGEKSTEAFAGQRAALNLANIKASTVYRGCELSIPDYFQPVYLIDCELFLHPDTKKNLSNRTRVRLHIFTTEIMVRVILIDKEVLKPGETCLVQFRLEKSIVAERNDRYIIRSYSPAYTIGGGRVLRVYTHNLKRFKEDAISHLTVLSGNKIADIILVTCQKAASYYLAINDIMKLINVSRPEIRDSVGKLVKEGKLIIFNESDAKNIALIHAERLQLLEESLLSILDTFHKENSLKAGIKSDMLKTKLDKELPGEVFSFLVARLASNNKIISKNNQIAIYGSMVEISPADKKEMEKIAKIIEDQGVSPSSFEQLFPMKKGENARNEPLFNYLTESATIIEVDTSLYYHKNVITKLKKILSDYLNENDSISVAEFRNITDTSRKYAIPLLEYFDKTHFTKRVGDKRVLTL